MHSSAVSRCHYSDHRDSTLEALSDGLYVSPAIETADYHASLNKNSWFYVFDYQSKYGDYSTVCGPGARYDELFFIPVSPAQLNCF